MDYVDLRSDTVTLPTQAMREAMANAVLGDDVYGEDPTVNQLEEMAAERMGKEAGLFVPSGTMANLAAVLGFCGRGDEVIMGHLGHTFLFEGGGISALGGVHPHIIPNQPDGTLLLGDIQAAIREKNIHYPTSRLIILENTHNRCGGVPLAINYIRRVGELAKEKGIYLHLDGARIFNAAVAMNVTAAELAEPFDAVAFCLSKGLCAPVGSILCGKYDYIQQTRKIRKQLGGGMRQAGVIAAAGVVALKQMVDRLAEDHHRAKDLAQGLSTNPGLRLETTNPATNIVFVSLADYIPQTAYEVATKLLKYRIRVGAVDAHRFRLVTHYWVDDPGVERAIEAYKQVL